MKIGPCEDTSLNSIWKKNWWSKNKQIKEPEWHQISRRQHWEEKRTLWRRINLRLEFIIQPKDQSSTGIEGKHFIDSRSQKIYPSWILSWEGTEECSPPEWGKWDPGHRGSNTVEKLKEYPGSCMAFLGCHLDYRPREQAVQTGFAQQVAPGEICL